MEKLVASHSDMVNIITVSLDESASALNGFFSKADMNLPVYHGDGVLAQKYGVQAIPTLVIFDKAGEVVFSKPGAYPFEMLKGMAEQLAAE